MNAVATQPPSSSVLVSARASRRIATRREVLVPCQAVRERDFKLIADRTLDVSVDGVLLPVDEPILTGETLILSFPIPGMWIDAEATVTRVVHNRRPGDDGLAIGVLFDVIAPAARAALAGFLHGRPPPLPRRGPLARVRRGEDFPQLADQRLMDHPVVGAPVVERRRKDDAPPRPLHGPTRRRPEPEGGPVDALGILRELACAWKNLGVGEPH